MSKEGKITSISKLLLQINDKCFRVQNSKVTIIFFRVVKDRLIDEEERFYILIASLTVAENISHSPSISKVLISSGEPRCANVVKRIPLKKIWKLYLSLTIVISALK